MSKKFITLNMYDSGICFQAFIPMRKEPDERSEMTSQVLYGESFTILENRNGLNYSLVQLDHDNYEGWVDSKCITPLTENDKNYLALADKEITHNISSSLKSSKTPFPLIIGCGSTVRHKEKKVIDLTENEYSYTENIDKILPDNLRLNLIKFGQNLIGIPYLWGGRSGFGLDCSGLCQNLFKQVGIIIPRDSGLQSAIGETINIEESQAGDLAFFENQNGKIVHVGMIIGQNLILHASGKVRIDKIDSQGIFSNEMNKYTHKLRVIKKIVD